MGCANCGPSLPLTFTVRFYDLPENYSRTGSCGISFSSDFGSGAEAVCTAPAGVEDDRGPMATIVVTNGGSCYARLGRVAPSLSAKAARGDGATFSVSLTELADDDGFAYWAVASVAVAGGTGYQDGEPVRIRIALGDTVISNAIVTLQASAPDGVPTGTTVVDGGVYFREDAEAAPYVASISVTDGNCTGITAATLEAVVDEDPASATFGQVLSVTVVDGGAGYLCKTFLDIDGGGDVEEICYSRINSYEDIDRAWVVRSTDPRRLVGLCIRSCFGSGATGSIDAYSFADEPGETADPSPGPIPRVSLTGGGSGYAVRARTEPVFQVLGSGTGATFTFEYEEQEDHCGLPYWTLTAVNVADGNDDWTDGETLTITGATAADIAAPSATATLQTTRENATIESWSVTCGGGSGAQLTFEFDDDDESYWFIKRVVVQNGGSGYLGTTLCPQEHLPIEVVFADGDTVIAMPTLVATAHDGIIVAVHVVDRGTFYRSLGVPRRVSVTSPGRSYRETTGSPYVADVVVDVDQELPSNGSGAVVTADIDDDIDSNTFGEIIALTLTNGGTNYTLFGGGRAGRDGTPVEFEGQCTNYKTISMSVGSESAGSTVCPPRVRLTLSGYGTFEGELPCDGDSSTLAIVSGGPLGEVVITGGGTYSEDEGVCSDECEECDDNQVDITVDWCDMQVTIALPIPGSVGFAEDPDPPADSYLNASADIDCVNCGWVLTIGVCGYCAATDEFASDGFTAFIPFADVEAPPNGNYCPQGGAVALECLNEQFNLECVTSVTATVS